VRQLIEDGYPDDITFHKIRKLLNVDLLATQTCYVCTRVDWRILCLESLIESLQNKPLISTYLDIGCNSGNITSALGNHLNLPSSFVHGCDVLPPTIWTQDYGSYAQLDTEDTTLPYASSSFSLVTCFVSLHHVEKLEDTLKEIRRVMAPNGLLFIREHDVSNDSDEQVFLDLVHAANAIVVFPSASSNGFNDSFYTNLKEHFAMYRSREVLARMIVEVGFEKGANLFDDEVATDSRKTGGNLQRLYSALFQLRDPGITHSFNR
jgi:SAM-dependent methyltransferase